jgi:hypothetical protein
LTREVIGFLVEIKGLKVLQVDKELKELRV